MKDYIIRAITDDENIRAFCSITTETVENARRIHNTSPVATAALGRTLTAAGIMGVMSKGDDDTITIQIKGNGPLGGIVAVSDSKANVRGYVHNPDIDMPINSRGKLNVGGAVGKGYLNIIKDMGLKEPYIGQVPLVSGEIGEDLAYYFTVSEQINSAVGLGVLIEKDLSVAVSGGFIIQVMPGISETAVEKLENSIKEISSITNLFKEYNSPEEIIKYILREFEVKITDKNPTVYKCNCSKERVERALISLGKKELQKLIDEQGQVELNCHFCDKVYQFNKEELLKLF